MALRNIIGAILILSFALWYGYLASILENRLTADGEPGANFFPFLITGMLLVFGSILLIQGLRCSKDISGIADLLPAEKSYDLFKPTAGVIVIALYFTALKFFGFMLCTPPFFATLILLSGERRLGYVFVLSTSIPLLLYSLFQYIFQLPLPKGSLI